MHQRQLVKHISNKEKCGAKKRVRRRGRKGKGGKENVMEKRTGRRGEAGARRKLEEAQIEVKEKNEEEKTQGKNQEGKIISCNLQDHKRETVHQ